MSKKAKLAFVLFIVGLAIIAFPIILGLVLSNEGVKGFLTNTLSFSNEAFAGLFIDYLALSATIFLGVIVFFQSQRINELEATQYQTYVGIEKVDYSFDFGDFLVIDKTNTVFNIAHNLDSDKKALLKIISIGGGKGQPLLIPLVFITKNQPLIVSLIFRSIVVDIKGNEKRIYNDTIPIDGDRINTILCDGSRFLFGLGMIVPLQEIIDEVHLSFELEVEDQNGFVWKYRPKAALHRAKNKSEFILTSSYSLREK